MKKTTLFTLALTLSIILLTGCHHEEKMEKVKKESATSTTTQQEAENTSTIETTNPEKTMSEFNQKAAPTKGEEIVVIKTNKGDIKLRLFPEYAPKTVENFKKLANDKFYNGLIFHRIIQGFMIQGGDPDGNGTGGPGYTIPAEFTPKLVHFPGALATARLGGPMNPTKASSGSQFYIVHEDARFLDGEYTVFGQVFEGMDIVNTIAEVATLPGDKPVEDVVMESVSVEKN